MSASEAHMCPARVIVNQWRGGVVINRGKKETEGEFTFYRHTGLVPVSRLQRALVFEEAWTPEQVRGDGESYSPVLLE